MFNILEEKNIKAEIHRGKNLYIYFIYSFFSPADPLSLSWQSQHQTLHLQLHFGVQPRLVGISQCNFLIPVEENLIAPTQVRVSCRLWTGAETCSINLHLEAHPCAQKSASRREMWPRRAQYIVLLSSIHNRKMVSRDHSLLQEKGWPVGLKSHTHI